MRNLFILLVLLIGLSQNTEAQTVYRCGAMTTKNVPCKIRVKELGAKCHHHATQTEHGTVYRCGALTAKGKPCKRKVKIAGAKCYSHQE